jgi:uncharacterized repeat protein (TIGR02543 family)
LNESITGTISVYAKWRRTDLNGYGITFVYPDEENNVTLSSCKTEEINTWNIPQVPPKEGYKDGVWLFEGKTLEEIIDELEDLDEGYTDDIVLYPSYTPITYTITYDLNGGDDDDDVEYTVSYTVESDLDLVVPTKEGYEFKGWRNLNDEARYDIQAGTTGNLELVAQWRKIGPSISTEINNFIKGIDGAFRTFATAENAVYVGATAYITVETGEIAGSNPIEINLEFVIKACIDSENADNNAVLIEVNDATVDGFGTVAAILFKTEGTKEVIYFGQKVINNDFTWRKFSQVEDAKLMSKMVTDMLFGEDFATAKPIGYKMASNQGFLGGMAKEMLVALPMIDNLLIFETAKYTPNETEVVFPETQGKESFVLTVLPEEIVALLQRLGPVIDISSLLDMLQEEEEFNSIDNILEKVLGKTFSELISDAILSESLVYPSINFAVGYNGDETLSGFGIHYDHSNSLEMPIKFDIGIKDLEVIQNSKEIVPTEEIVNPEEASIEFGAQLILRGAGENPINAELKAYIFPDIRLTFENSFYDGRYEWRHIKDSNGALIVVSEEEITGASNDIIRGEETYRVPGKKEGWYWVADEIEEPTATFEYRVKDGFIQKWVDTSNIPVPTPKVDITGLKGYATISKAGGEEIIFADFNADRPDGVENTEDPATRVQSGFKIDLAPILNIFREGAAEEYIADGNSLKYFISQDMVEAWMSQFIGTINSSDELWPDTSYGEEFEFFDMFELLEGFTDIDFSDEIIEQIEALASEGLDVSTPIGYIAEFTQARKELSISIDIEKLMTTLLSETGLISEIESEETIITIYYDEQGNLLPEPIEMPISEFLSTDKVLQTIVSLINFETAKELADSAWWDLHPDAYEYELEEARDAYFIGEETDWELLFNIPIEELITIDHILPCITNITGIEIDRSDAYAGLKLAFAAILGENEDKPLTSNGGASFELSLSYNDTVAIGVFLNVSIAGENAEKKLAYLESDFAKPFAEGEYIDIAEAESYSNISGILLAELMIFVLEPASPPMGP